MSQPVCEALAHAGAFDSLETTRTRRDRLFEAMTTEPLREGEQLALAVHEPLTTALPEYSDAERVRAELDVLGIDASRHVISFFGSQMAELGVTRSADLRKLRAGDRVTVAGVKVASQTPAVRSGQRIIFLTLDDSTGLVEVTVFESAQAKCARVVFHSFVLAVRGTLRRVGVAGVSVIAEEAIDLVAMATEQGQDLAAIPAKRLWHASPGSAG